MRRRVFLAGAAAASAAPLLHACRAHDGAAASPGGAAATPGGATADLGDWEQVRRQFPLDYSWIHMAQFLMTSHPAPVRAAIEAHRRGLDENPALYIEENVGRYETATREAAAGYMGCRPDDLAMTDSTKTKDNKGLLGARTEKVSREMLIPGLKVEITEPPTTPATLSQPSSPSMATIWKPVR